MFPTCGEEKFFVGLGACDKVFVSGPPPQGIGVPWCRKDSCLWAPLSGDIRSQVLFAQRRRRKRGKRRSRRFVSSKAGWHFPCKLASLSSVVLLRDVSYWCCWLTSCCQWNCCTAVGETRLIGMSSVVLLLCWVLWWATIFLKWGCMVPTDYVAHSFLWPLICSSSSLYLSDFSSGCPFHRFQDL